MAVSVAQTCNALNNNQDSVELAKLLNAMQADIAAMRTALIAVTAKLDTANIAPDNYGTVNPPALQSAA